MQGTKGYSKNVRDACSGGIDVGTMLLRQVQRWLWWLWHLKGLGLRESMTVAGTFLLGLFGHSTSKWI